MIEDGKYYCLSDEGKKYFYLTKYNLLFKCVKTQQYKGFCYKMIDQSSELGFCIKLGKRNYKRLQSYFIQLTEDEVMIRDIIL
jgi:hypothetical protein